MKEYDSFYNRVYAGDVISGRHCISLQGQCIQSGVAGKLREKNGFKWKKKNLRSPNKDSILS